MKRLYTFMLSAAVAVAASAAIPSAKSTVSGQLSDLKTTGRIISETVASRAVVEAKANQPRKAASRSVSAPTSAQDLVDMQWEASYEGMLNNNAGTHSGSATFTLDSNGRPMLKLPDYNNNLLVNYDAESSSLIIYGTVNYGQNSQGYDMKLQPITTSGQPTSSNGVAIPFNTEIGAFEFPSNFAWGMLAYSGDSMAGYFWAGYQFTLSIADGDYSIVPEFSGSEVSADNKWTIKVSAADDVAAVKYLVLPYDIEAAEYANLITAYGDYVINGSITVDPVNNNAEGETMTESGYGCVLFASYDAEGALKKVAHIALPVIFDDEQEGWANVGTVEFVDGLFSQYYQDFSYSKNVLVQAKTDNTPVYRFVAPYSDYPVYNLAGHTHSMVIDATHSDWVAIPCTFSGLDLAGDGVLAFGSFAALGYDYASAIKNKLEGGKIEGNVVTFPTRTILAHEQFYNTPGSWNYANSSEAITITLPAITLKVAAINEKGNTPAEGIEVKVGNEVVTTDAEGNATINVPFTTGYFGEVAMTINGEEVTVTLNGAENTYNYVIPAPVEVWNSVGEGEWREGLLPAANPWSFPTGLTWKIDVEESDATPGIYRIKPYAVENSLTEMFGLDKDEETVLIIDATDPAKVYTTAESNFYPYGFCKFIGNNPENGEEGEVYGTLKNGVITFPESSFYLDDEYAGKVLLENGSFKVVLPGATSEVERIEMGAIVGEVGEYIKVRPEVFTTDETLPAPALTWTSTNPEVVNVDEDGKVWFNSPGSATVVAESNGVEVSIPFEIEAVMARALNVFPVEATGGKGKSLCLLAIHEPDNTTDKSVVWESANPEIASVDETGHVELLAPGTTHITATSGEHTASCSITVDDTDSLIEMASTGVVIDIVEGGINVRHAEEGAAIAVYTIDGKVINGAVATTEETHIDLVPGIYIVKVSPDTIAKVLVK